MSFMPGWRSVAKEPDLYANTTLELMYREIGLTGGLKRFGRVSTVPSWFPRFVRDTINWRNREGVYVFMNNAEYKRMKPICSVYAERGGPVPVVAS
jgi:hypothetical protein